MTRKAIDLTGQKFGRLTVVKRVENRGKQPCWLCECECGKIKNVISSNLKSGHTTSCGCYQKEKAKEFIDLTGQKFGRLTVVKRAENKGEKICWLCQCECGNMKIIQSTNLKNNTTTSCGCLRKEKVSEIVKDLTGQKFGRLTVIKRAENKGGQVAWICKCECGVIKRILGISLTSGRTISCGCYNREKRYKGGISSISEHLRHLPILAQWRKNTYLRENSKCQLTGKHVHGGNSDVHHLKGFNTIVKEAHDLYNIQTKKIVADYTKEELELLTKYIESWHNDTVNAVLLCNEVHDLFHSLYGKGNNTPEQYIEFKERYLAGEFKEILKTREQK